MDIIKKLFHKKRSVPFDTLFSRFRQTISHHNRAVELIADMGEKLGGDYLFDIVYLRRAYSELHDTLSDSLEEFALLTGNRFPQLGDVFAAVDRAVRRLLYNETHSLSGLVLWYEEIRWHMSPEVGGKNSNLAEVANKLLLPVPAAFVLTTAAFDDFMRHNGLDKEIEALRVDEQGESGRLENMRSRILDAMIPPALETAVDKALAEMKRRCGDDCSLAVRSSAEAEDGDHSYAGQFETRLNVIPETGAVLRAYREVAASLFSDKAVLYQRQLGDEIGEMKMAVGCLCMVDARASGVVYSADPGGKNEIVVTSAWGLGEALVEGQAGYDEYTVSRDEDMPITGRKIGKKPTMVVAAGQGGVAAVPVEGDRAEKESLSDEQVRGLAEYALRIERHFGRPQDIEWALDSEGKIVILQARPLKIAAGADGERTVNDNPTPPARDARILMAGAGTIVRKGAAAGRVFILERPDDLEHFPRGAVLAARHDSSDFIRVMPYAAAIITDAGSPSSHMSALCREFRVPAVVAAGNATSLLTHGREVTLIAGDDGMTVYEGIMPEAAVRASAPQNMEELREFRKKRYVLRYISPLHLIDPFQGNFTPEGCGTMHDILRFIHEKSVMELVDNALRERSNSRAAKLELPVPAGITVVDIGGGLVPGAPRDSVTIDSVASIPFRALLKGLVEPGMWQSDAVPLTARDFMSSMMRMPDIASGSGEFAGSNVALVSRDYVNLSIRFGYHFTVADCYCSEMTGNNHLYFRFSGGATDMAKRSRRVRVIELILREFGFKVRIRGDLLVGRIANVESSEMEGILEMTGRLLAFTRQLDAMLHSDGAVHDYVKDFLRR